MWEAGPKAEVPALVRRYLERAVPAGALVPRRVRIAQAGEMWQKPGGRPLRFSAVEELAVAEVAFSWRARFSLAPLVWLRVVDDYAGGEGRLEARLFGLVPMLRSRGPELSEGEAFRYLAELPWVPQAILANRELDWRDLDARTVEVATRFGSSRLPVRLAFDAAGDIVESSADARARFEGRKVVRSRWGGSFGDYGTVGGAASRSAPRCAGSCQRVPSPTGAARSRRSRPISSPPRPLEPGLVAPSPSSDCLPRQLPSPVIR